MKKSEAIEILIEIIFSATNNSAILNRQEAEEVLDKICDQEIENPIGLYPPMNKKGRHVWEDE